ncbi:MAG: ABC transporter permease [Xanthomonadaceae bacterium]|nr:ABC transporter permease [Xanthomonadaceae bacterium]
MFAYILKRILYTIPILFGVSLIVFVLFHLVGGDPTYQMVGKHSKAEQIAQLRHELGLDQSLPMQYLHYVKQIVTFDYGRSYATKQPIGEMISRGAGPSLILAIPAFIITTIAALLIALVSAYYRGRFIDKFVLISCVIGMSAPSLAYILFGQYVLAYKFGIFPISGFEAGFPEALSYVAMPAFIWLVVSMGADVRFFRNAILEETNQDYVRTARSKGLEEKVVYFKHVLKNSMIPIVTYVVIEIPFLLLGAFLLESFFGIPGLGSMTIDAINSSDFPVLKAMTTVNSILFILGTLATDILYTLVDPRVSFK